MSGDRLFAMFDWVPSVWKTPLGDLFALAVMMILASIKHGIPWKLLNGEFQSRRKPRRNVWEAYEDFPEE